MSLAVLAGIIISFFGALLLVMVAIIGFLIKGAVKEQARREEKAEQRDKDLTNSIDGLKDAIWKLREQFVLRKDYDRDMALLRVTGRRQSDGCPQEDCPLMNLQDARQTRPGGHQVLHNPQQDGDRS